MACELKRSFSAYNSCIYFHEQFEQISFTHSMLFYAGLLPDYQEITGDTTCFFEKALLTVWKELICYDEQAVLFGKLELKEAHWSVHFNQIIIGFLAQLGNKQDI